MVVAENRRGKAVWKPLSYAAPTICVGNKGLCENTKIRYSEPSQKILVRVYANRLTISRRVRLMPNIFLACSINKQITGRFVVKIKHVIPALNRRCTRCHRYRKRTGMPQIMYGVVMFPTRRIAWLEDNSATSWDVPVLSTFYRNSADI